MKDLEQRKNLRTAKRQPSTQGGFTLIEMIVAVSLFTIVIFVSIGALLAISDASRKANSLRSVMDNLNFAIESMSRSIRTGTDYACAGGGNCVNGGTEFSFIDQRNVAVTYKYDASTQSIMVQKDGGVFRGITSAEVQVEGLTFYVAGVGADGKQPRIIITARGVAGLKEKTKTSFSIQTTVSQRQIES
ncbi:MAG: type II secretion system GspH family protein [Patescibacteria group bacterium]|nr:type II secretion system GspH family protein [Patescibacteria group bacterium]